MRLRRLLPHGQAALQCPISLPECHLPSKITLGREDTFLPMSFSAGMPRNPQNTLEALAGCIQMGRQAPHPLALFQTTIYCLGKLVLTASEMSGRRTNRAENSSLVMTAPDGTWDPAAQPCPRCMHCEGSYCSSPAGSHHTQ